MVKVGFIVEGACEKIVVESNNFRQFLQENGYELITPVIDAHGGGNLLPKNIEVHTQNLKKKGVEQIYILTDLEKRSDKNELRQLLQHDDVQYTFIAVKAIEAWFLADTMALKNWLGNDNVQPETSPEESGNKMPWDYLKDVANQYQARGTGSMKPQFAKRMVTHWDFSIKRAAQHPNCPSAKELVAHFQNKVSQQ